VLSASQGRVSTPVYSRVVRAALFSFVGVFNFAYWLIADPGYEESATQTEWPYVLGFSVTILSLAFAYPVFAQLVGGRVVSRVSLVPAAGFALGSLVNIVEDGLGMEWAFFGFVLTTAIGLLGLLALTAVVTYVGRGGYRLLALVPAATIVGVIAYVPAGGPILLATWLAAAALALVLPRHTPAQPALATQ
jgi:hypothetical protein